MVKGLGGNKSRSGASSNNRADFKNIFALASNGQQKTQNSVPKGQEISAQAKVQGKHNSISKQDSLMNNTLGDKIKESSIVEFEDYNNRNGKEGVNIIVNKSGSNQRIWAALTTVEHFESFKTWMDNKIMENNRKGQSKSWAEIVESNKQEESEHEASEQLESVGNESGTLEDISGPETEGGELEFEGGENEGTLKVDDEIKYRGKRTTSPVQTSEEKAQLRQIHLKQSQFKPGSLSKQN